MTFTLKRWQSLGLGAALASSAVLAGCSGEKAGEAGAAAKATHPAGHSAVSGEGEGGEGEGGVAVGAAVIDMAALPIEKRAAFMAGHVAAGLALYRAGDAAAAAKHLEHPVTEVHATERAGMDALGFDPDIFNAVSAALAAGRPASEIEPLLAEAEANLSTVRTAAGGSKADIANFLMDVCLEEYKAGVNSTGVVNAGEYQDAYGFAAVATQLIKEARPDPQDPLHMEAAMLMRMWPKEGPVAASKTPAPVDLLAGQVARVKLELSALE